ncbi:TetR/AcrR family transcriptional regulator [Algoriphagus halophytocola]|uniref:TetR/AcrR family transcriptional regulator n=1 Tax=Algoriphagus halophytocola TaxID=2991499 RepID=A0ABY6ML13_9BACT|nr:TetR/AcrR family transcriptional regulator [Algoriphagus sp. TR-M5]UZD24214.1 TetR/AcrR family transcriptional regulator [Algoriphagus sp. TR-M5]
MTKKSQKESKILDVAYQLFLEKGYRQTTMDEIAQVLGMSKKTLYKYYPGKIELLSATFEVLKTKLTAKVEGILDNKYLPFPLKLKSTLTVMASHLAPINPELFEDLREYAPEVWEDLQSYINESAYIRFQQLITQGVSLGLINPSTNINLVVMMYAAAVQSLLDPRFTGQFPEEMQKGLKIPASDIYDQVTTIIYNGILTDEAREEFANA